ncbi:MAG: hypothetical protein M1825_006392 [Sarcosagium campestre]|nr:MAG: hypothetical protein M1825_006392 [Sarcosagium campestre]
MDNPGLYTPSSSDDIDLEKEITPIVGEVAKKGQSLSSFSTRVVVNGASAEAEADSQSQWARQAETIKERERRLRREERNLHRNDTQIENWLDTLGWSRRARTRASFSLGRQGSDSGLARPTDERMTASQYVSMPEPYTESTTSFVTPKQRTFVSARDWDFRFHLGGRNADIETGAPPSALRERILGILNRARDSPEMDDDAFQQHQDRADVANLKTETIFTDLLCPKLLPDILTDAGRHLKRNANHIWSDCVRLPINDDFVGKRVPICRPKPDLTFGYAATAFNREQHEAARTLVDESGHSFVVPDRETYFPFLIVELKTERKGGNLSIADNQIANASSIAVNGLLELARRVPEAYSRLSRGEEPHFFSLSVTARVSVLNVHWISFDAENAKRPMLHVRGLQMNDLQTVEGLRASQRAVKNILNYAANEHLQFLRHALDAYARKLESARVRASPRKGRKSSRGEQKRRHVGASPCR